MIPGKMDGYSEFLHIVTETVNHQQNFMNKKSWSIGIIVYQKIYKKYFGTFYRGCHLVFYTNIKNKTKYHATMST